MSAALTENDVSGDDEFGGAAFCAETFSGAVFGAVGAAFGGVGGGAGGGFGEDGGEEEGGG